MKNPVNQEAMRKKLVGLMQRLEKGLPGLKNEALRSISGEAGGGLSNVPLHPADLASVLTEEEVSMALLENETNLAVEIGDALDRLDAGQFSTCEQCSREIARQRLDVIPYARFCLGCAQAAQSS